jgi:hypothetical protein
MCLIFSPSTCWLLISFLCVCNHVDEINIFTDFFHLLYVLGTIPFQAHHAWMPRGCAVPQCCLREKRKPPHVSLAVVPLPPWGLGNLCLGLQWFPKLNPQICVVQNFEWKKHASPSLMHVYHDLVCPFVEHLNICYYFVYLVLFSGRNKENQFSWLICRKFRTSVMIWKRLVWMHCNAWSSHWAYFILQTISEAIKFANYNNGNHLFGVGNGRGT